jgi:hypothetical protein
VPRVRRRGYDRNVKACSPLLRGVVDPLDILRVVTKHPVLCHSESSFVFYPLQDLGWVEYAGGRWQITKAGTEALGDVTEPDDPEPDLASFFGIGGN